VVRTPRYATAVGLLEEALAQRMRGRKVAEQSGSFKETLRRMKEWFLGNF
jgi:cell division protein FtsA